MKILVAGATGALGTKVVDTLLASVPSRDLAVSVRDPGKAAHLAIQGISVRMGDYRDPASLDSAFAGVEKLLFIPTRGDDQTHIRQHLNAVSAAKRAEVKHLIFASIAKADTSTLKIADLHRTTEKAIREARIPYTILRNNWCIENEIGVIQGILAGGPLVTSAGDGKVSWALLADYAKAAAAILLGTGHENRTYEVSGPPATYRDLAAALSRIIGREIPVRQVDDSALAKVLAEAAMPGPMVEYVVGIHSAIRDGALEVKSRDFETLLGRSVIPLKDQVAAVMKEMAVRVAAE